MRNPQVDSQIAHAPDWARPILEVVRDAIHSAEPAVQETVTWGPPTFEKEGLVCSMRAFKDHVAVWFFKGALLPDPAGLLAPGAKAETRRSSSCARWPSFPPMRSWS